MAGITKQRLKELVKEVMVEETEYQAFFQKALDKAGKSIPSMSDDEKKAFFDKIDSAWSSRGEKTESTIKEGIWPKSKLASPFQMQLSLELKKKFKGVFYSVGYDLYHNNKKVLTIDGDEDSINSVIAKLKKIVKESIDTNYWIKYNKNPNGESSQSKKSNNFEYTFKDALNDWNSEGEDVVSGSDAQKIKKLAKEFFDKEGYITYNIVYAMIMQS